MIKKTILISVILFITIFLFLQGCKNNKNPSSTPIQGTFKIKGNFNGVTSLGMHSLDAPLVAKVILYNRNGGIPNHSVSDVTNGAFELSNQYTGVPAGLVFVDVSNNYLGYLTLGGGVDSLPLNEMNNGVNTIDLQSITFTASAASPSHNPIGSEIPMTQSDLIAYAFCNGPFSTLLKYPDVDGNGVIDMLEGSYYGYYVNYDVTGGTFSGTTTVLNNPVAISYYSLSIAIHDPAGNPAGIHMQGASGSGIESVDVTQDTMPLETGLNSYTTAAVSMSGGVPSVPPAGSYVATYTDRTLTFNIPDQSKITSDLAVPVPSVVLNIDGTINKISWIYKINAGSGQIDPQALVLYLNIIINTGSGSYQSGVPGQNGIPASQTSYVMANQSVPWSSVDNMIIRYNDIFGNAYNVTYTAP